MTEQQQGLNQLALDKMETNLKRINVGATLYMKTG